jgi:hypothetical protein
MASRYSIIQYVPNPIANERINIGVIVFDEEVVKVHFLRSWERINSFGKEDTKFLRDFAKRMDESSKNGLLFPNDDPNSGQSRVERLRNVSQEWINSIQFTPPRGSIESIDNVFDYTIKAFLVDETPVQRNMRDRQAAKKIVATSVRDVLKQRLGKRASEFLKKDAQAIVKGLSDSHKFDVSVANGRPYLAAHGVSFEVLTHKETLDALSWWIKDVKELNRSFPLAVVTLPPKAEFPNYSQLREAYDNTRITYNKLGATVLEEKDVSAWTNQILASANLV